MKVLFYGRLAETIGRDLDIDAAPGCSVAELRDRLIAEHPRTAYELAQEMWGNVAVTQAFLTLSEVVGHVDLLIDAGLVCETEDGGVVRFEATGAEGEIAIPPTISS